MKKLKAVEYLQLNQTRTGVL